MASLGYIRSMSQRKTNTGKRLCGSGDATKKEASTSPPVAMAVRTYSKEGHERFPRTSRQCTPTNSVMLDMSLISHRVGGNLFW